MNKPQQYERIPFADMALPVRINHDMTLTSGNVYHENFFSFHEQIEILFFHSGEADVYCGNRAYSVKAGDVIIINPYEIHQVAYKSGNPLYDCLMIDGSLYKTDSPENEAERYFNLLSDYHVCFNNHITNDSEFTGCIRAICNEMKHKELMYELSVKSHIYNMLIFLFRRYVYSGSPFRQLVKNIEWHDRIKPALELMKNNSGEHIPLEKMAGACHLSSSHFCRVFRQITGYSPVRYMMDIRLQEAAAMLKRTDKSITEIAYQSGFDDVGYFSRRFKAQFGISPTRAKKML